ncbi:MAG: hypothetical protein J0L92_28730 [Deltaproteobacteria bacterium]|nr:hypothetical protein [Deltaproteobacteria bacterium]
MSRRRAASLALSVVLTLVVPACGGERADPLLEASSRIIRAYFDAGIALRGHIANLARAMTSEQRAQVATVLAETGAERDAEIAATLGEAHASLLSNR